MWPRPRACIVLFPDPISVRFVFWERDNSNFAATPPHNDCWLSSCLSWPGVKWLTWRTGRKRWAVPPPWLNICTPLGSTPCSESACTIWGNTLLSSSEWCLLSFGYSRKFRKWMRRTIIIWINKNEWNHVRVWMNTYIEWMNIVGMECVWIGGAVYSVTMDARVRIWLVSSSFCRGDWQLKGCSVTRPFLSLRRVWLARLYFMMSIIETNLLWKKAWHIYNTVLFSILILQLMHRSRGCNWE